MTKQEVINYITETPGNTNPAVLSTILNEFGASDNKQEIELSATENKVYTPAEGKVYNKVTVNVPAPSSDFSTATVTFHMTNAGDEMAANIDVVNIDGYSMGHTVAVYSAEEQYEIVLYKGSGTISPIGNTEFTSVSGDAELSYGSVYAHGDCTVVCEGVYVG